MKISPREMEVLRLVSEGFTDKEISMKLLISPHTVSGYVQRVMDRNNARSRTHAVAMMISITLQSGADK